jgi:hypothetical protein
MLAGILSVATSPDRRDQTDRLLDLVVAGLSPGSLDTSSAATR